MQRLFDFDHHLMLENDAKALIFKINHSSTATIEGVAFNQLNTVYSNTVVI